MPPSNPKDEGNAKKCCGFPLGVVLMLWHSTTLGIDYTIWISTATLYFGDIINHTGAYNASDANETALLLDESTAAFSVAQSVWAAGQLSGCLASAPLPRVMGYRWAFIFLVFLSVFGNVMYSVAGIVGGVSGKWVAWIGKALDGFGDGSVALGLGYVPIAMFSDRKRLRTAMINYRALMALGMMMGAGVSIGLDYIDIPEPMGTDGEAREFSGGDLVGWAMACIYFPSLFFACCALDNSKPPVAKGKGGKKGAVCTPYFTKKSCFWLFLVFSYGLTGSLATYFLPVFPYCPGFCNDESDLATITLAQYISYVTLGAFFAGFLGAFFNSVVSVMKRCNISGLPLLRVACMLITVSMALMYSGYRLYDEEASEVGTGQLLFIAGICLYFLSSTSLSAGMAPVFKEIIPKTSLSIMMPLYKICLDGGKIVGPLYSDWASTESSDVWETRADVAFVPSLVMYVLITLAIVSLGKYLSTPDFKVPDDSKSRETPMLKQESKQAEMTPVATSNQYRVHQSAVNTYDNQDPNRQPSRASTQGYDLYAGSSMSYSQIADAKNIDSVKVSLVI